ncbi:DUF4012 domain-containing protein [Motilibacter peucedani]|uniref:DUF4012 domain-containing protein n=1 Tax=Motilibacter peucedani TaxID=598650 RepID=UPI0011C3B04F|nr:DUF4012 domain-containing protein [Motilibacter peucedani]
MTISDQRSTPPPEPGRRSGGFGEPERLGDPGDAGTAKVVWTHPLDEIESERPAEALRPRWWVRRRRLLLWTLVALLVVGALAGFATWLALGLQDSAKKVKTSATAAQDELTAFKDVARTDQAAAKSHLEAAALQLASAHAAADTPQMHIAGKVPYAKIPVSDLGHLLTAADLSVEAGRDALDVAAAVQPKTTVGGAPGIYSNGSFNIPVLRQATAKAERIRDLMVRAERELLAVDGTGVKEQEVPGIRDKALSQARDLRRQMESAIPLLQILPPALGANGPKTYLVTINNQAEMHGSGGAPLSVGTVTLTNGLLGLGTPSSTSDYVFPKALPQPTARGNANPPLLWKPVKGDPFYAVGTYANGKQATPFVTAGLNPDFRVAGESMARAWQGGTGQEVDGVVSLDVSAIRQLLAVTGPVQAPGYGEINAGNIAQALLADVYATADSPARHQLNAALMGAIVQRLASGEQLTDKAKALAAVAPGRHLQMWMKDSSLQQTLTENGFAGAISDPDTGDHIAVYSQNAGLTKVDALQDRTVDEVVRLAADGSAAITRTVTQHNKAADRTHGVIKSEQSGWARTGLISLLPKGAKVTKSAPAESGLGSNAAIVAGKSGMLSALEKPLLVDALGRPWARQTVQIAPGAVLGQEFSFSAPKVAVPTDTGMTVTLTYDPDNALNVTNTRVVVIPPAGYRVAPGDGVQVLAGQGVVNVALDRQRTVSVSLVKG